VVAALSQIKSTRNPVCRKEITMMTRRQAGAGILASAALAATSTVPAAEELRLLVLPPPRGEGGPSLTTALKRRRSIRDYADRPLPPQVLSDLLWAAFGVNRPSGDRTAPYWRHVIVIEIYLARPDGVWIYDPKAHVLLPHSADDIRAQTGIQDFVASAPLNLIYVAHGERMTDVSAEERRLYASVDTGFIGQNVYLFCAAEGLATVFRGSVDQSKLAQILKLPDQQFVTFAQTVGYPRA
jgi:nitroreductase